MIIVILRYFIEFAYNGKNFHGFQSQPDASSVQETLEKALSTLLRETIAIVGAGRTDSGVHAKQMYAHFETELELESDYWSHKLNSFLPPSIVVYCIFKVADEAHARFDATSRTYEYYMHTFKDAFITDGSWYHSHHLDFEKMNEACKILSVASLIFGLSLSILKMALEEINNFPFKSKILISYYGCRPIQRFFL